MHTLPSAASIFTPVSTAPALTLMPTALTRPFPEILGLLSKNSRTLKKKNTRVLFIIEDTDVLRHYNTSIMILKDLKFKPAEMEGNQNE